MSQSRKQLAQIAISAALKVRKRLHLSLDSPINVFDLCGKMGISVFFQDIPSMEGIYLPEATPKPVIVVSSQRPPGRQAMTCGHELGHHVFGHGKQWDELAEDRTASRRFEPEEFQADLFSAALQMPKLAVEHAATVRNICLAKCTAADAYALASLFGVSYGGFVTHSERTLGIVSMELASYLLKQPPQDIRAELLGESCPNNLLVVDHLWRDRAIDAQVGDVLLLPPTAEAEGTCIEITFQDSGKTVVKAIRPGIGRVVAQDWAAFVRVTRRNYIGLAGLRFDEEVDDDD